MKFANVYFLGGIVLLASCGAGGDEANNDEKNEAVENDSTANTEHEITENFDIYFTRIEKHKIPDNVKFEGNVIDANSWEDAKGKNYFVRSIGPVITDKEFDYSSQYLYAYHYCEKDGKMELIKETVDFEKDCEFDLIVSHVPTAITLTDKDGDNVGEVTFVYRKTCTSDVSGSEQKLIMLEYGDKYALRGFTEVMGEGGDYEIGEEFNSAPEGFLEHAKKIWEENRTEYDFEL